MRGISVLGSTGSIGTQTLDVIRRNKDIKVVALAAGNKSERISRTGKGIQTIFGMYWN